MSKEEFLKQALERYPVGTVYISPYQKDKTITAKVTGVLKASGDPKQKQYPGGLWITDGYGGSVYCFNAWAEIVGKSGGKELIKPGETLSLF